MMMVVWACNQDDQDYGNGYRASLTMTVTMATRAVTVMAMLSF